jgi:hypothetical protein
MNPRDESATTLEDLRGDLALRYKWTPTGGTAVDSGTRRGRRGGAGPRRLCHLGKPADSRAVQPQIREEVRPGSGTPDATPSRAGGPSGSTAC